MPWGRPCSSRKMRGGFGYVPTRSGAAASRGTGAARRTPTRATRANRARQLNSVAARRILGAPGIRERAQRLEEDHQVGLLARGEARRARELPVRRVATYDLGDRIDVALVAVRRRQHQVAQGRHLELAVGAARESDPLRVGSAARVVAV